MSLRYGLLGLLAEGPASGYDLTQRFEKMLRPIWPARHPQIYNELSKLAADGLIEIDSQGPRGRKVYRLTDAGLAEVRRWLTEVDVDHTMRMETLLRSLFFWLMRPDELTAHLEREERFYRESVAQFREFAAAKDRGDYGTGPQPQAMRVTIEAGIRFYEALAEWAKWARDRPPARPADPPEDGS